MFSNHVGWTDFCKMMLPVVADLTQLAHIRNELFLDLLHSLATRKKMQSSCKVCIMLSCRPSSHQTYPLTCPPRSTSAKIP